MLIIMLRKACLIPFTRGYTRISWGRNMIFFLYYADKGFKRFEIIYCKLSLFLNGTFFDIDI